MIHIQSFVFNPFSENTYILYDETGDCIIVDPGCWNQNEEKQLTDFIAANGLNPVRLINTHCHIDHILGNRFVASTYNLAVEAHEKESDNVRRADSYAAMFGMDSPNVPAIQKYLSEGQDIAFGHSKLEILFAPGHSPGHVVFFDRLQNFMIGGDVLFRESIGRTDLPGGDLSTLMRSIQEKIFALDDNMVVYSGHGPETTIGHEKAHNPFLQEAITR